VIRASAMTYAILLMLFIALFCMTILSISSGSKWLIKGQQNKEQVIANLFSGLSYALHQDIEGGQEYIIAGDTVLLRSQPWGIYSVITVTAWKNNYRKIKSYLIGQASDNTYALYLADTDQPLKITGNTLLKGKVSLPKKGVDRAYVEGKNFKGKELIEGQTEKSEKSLPKLNEQWAKIDVLEFYKTYDYTYMYELPFDSIFPFSESVIVYESPNSFSLSNQTLSGNLILCSQDSIYVRNTAELDNLLLIAPVIRVEKGFKGSLQLYATDRIEIEEDVVLQYPSSLYLQDKDKNFRREFDAQIHLHKNSIVSGGIVITSESPDFRSPVKLLIDEDVTVSGFVYNQGITQHQGQIWGTLYTKQFFLKTKSSSYINHLIDATIDRTMLPSFFVLPSILETDKTQKVLIKNL
jgi:hypothetical protein